jgi:hypothetical protein
MREAKKRGLESLVAFSNSPPVPWTRSGTGNNVATNSNTFHSSGKYTLLARIGNLRGAAGTTPTTPDHFPTFAAYLADIAEHFAQETVPNPYPANGRGAAIPLRINHISLTNEPQWEWNEDKQEGSGWNNANIAKLARAVDAAIQDSSRPNISPENTKIMIGEAAQWDFLTTANGYSAPNQINAFFDPTSATYIGNLPSMKPWKIAGHTYFTHSNDSTTASIRTQVAQRAAQRAHADNDNQPIQVWSTEWCALGAGDGLSTQYGYFEVALFMAKLAFQDIMLANARTFSFWTALDMERGATDRYSLIGIAPGSPTYNLTSYETNSILEPGSVKSQPTLWALGHYSLFVRPGFRRVGIASEGQGINLSTGYMQLMATAYKSPDGYVDFTTGKPLNRIVVVYVNVGATARTVAGKFPEELGLPTSIRCFNTTQANTETMGVNGLGMRPAGHEDGIITIPGKSMVTVVYDNFRIVEEEEGEEGEGEEEVVE